MTEIMTAEIFLTEILWQKLSQTSYYIKVTTAAIVHVECIYSWVGHITTGWMSLPFLVVIIY